MEIYERVFSILKDRGMTQKELSIRTGISQSTISDWKNKRVNPSADKLLILSDALGVSVYDILKETESKYEPADYVIIGKDSKEYALIEAYQKSDASSKIGLMRYVQELKGVREEK